MKIADAKKLYTAIGYIVSKWGFIETYCSMITNTLYENSSLPEKPARIPKFADQQYRFVLCCLYDCAELRPIKVEGESLINETKTQNDMRQYFVHSALRTEPVRDQVYAFVRLDAKDIDHQATDWEFDLKTFPDLELDLHRLSDAWFLFAEKVIHTYEAPSQSPSKPR